MTVVGLRDTGPCSDKFLWGHIEIDVVYQTCYLSRSQFADTGPSAWQGSYNWAHFYSFWAIYEIIMIASKGAIREFSVSSLRRELSPTRTLKWPERSGVQITCNTSSARHLQHALLRCHVVRRDSSAIKYARVEIAFI